MAARLLLGIVAALRAGFIPGQADLLLSEPVAMLPPPSPSPAPVLGERVAVS